MKSCASPIGAALNDASHKVNGRAACAPGNLHPGGFGVCPVALMLDSRATPVHLAIYLALASTLSGNTASGRPYLNRVAERAHVSFRTVLRRVEDLEAWGYIIVRRREGCRSEYLLCPTAPLPTHDTGVTGSEATPDTGGTAPCHQSHGTHDTGVTPPQIQDQSSIQTRGTPPTPLEGAAPAPTDGAGGSPPTPPFPDLSVDLRKFLDYHGWLGDASFVREVGRSEQKDGTRAAIRGVEVAMHYGLRPRVPVPASECRS